jgi:S1-C subfamily serine protease
MRFHIPIILALAGTVLSISDAYADAFRDCLRATAAIDKTTFCSIVIDRPANRKQAERAFLRRGNAFMELRQFSAAAADFNTLIKLAPSIAGYRDNRAHALAELGRWSDALSEADATIGLAPKQSFGFRTRGNIFLAVGRPAAALGDFTTGLSIDPGDVGLKIDKGRALSRLGRDREAISSFSAAIDSDPRAVSAYRERGLAYKRTGNLRAAASDLAVVVELDPADLEAAGALDAVRAALAAPTTPGPRPPLGAHETSPESPRRRQSSGTGFFVNVEGYVATNAHVVDKCDSIVVISRKRERAAAKLAARDETNDLAVLETPLHPEATATIRSGVRLGENIAAFGFPLAGMLSTSGNFTPGSVTALTGLGDDSRYLQISAPVQPGNSGGPLLDHSGSVVGIVSAKLNALKVMLANNGDIPQNVNFAIKGRVLSGFLESNNIAFTESLPSQPIASPELADKAAAMSVFVLCQ